MQEIGYLFLTILVEAPIAIFLLRRERWQRVLLITVCVNAVSHPVAWQSVAYGANWWLVEGLVAVFEGLVFALFFSRLRCRASFAAVMMNLASAVIGMVM